MVSMLYKSATLALTALAFLISVRRGHGHSKATGVWGLTVS
jgi:hypothetical protein